MGENVGAKAVTGANVKGADAGDPVGNNVGDNVGTTVGATVGATETYFVGALVGCPAKQNKTKKNHNQEKTF